MVKINDVYGTFVVQGVDYVDVSGHKVWRCVCTLCGYVATYPQYKLKKAPACSKCRPDRKHYKMEDYDNPAFHSYQAMINRCTVPTSKDYPTYGGRGISVCEAWLNSFEQFLKDVGPRPEGQTLDRINYNGNYEPGNVRWATLKVQAKNKRFRTQSLLHKLHFPKKDA